MTAFLRDTTWKDKIAILVNIKGQYWSEIDVWFVKNLFAKEQNLVSRRSQQNFIYQSSYICFFYI